MGAALGSVLSLGGAKDATAAVAEAAAVTTLLRTSLLDVPMSSYMRLLRANIKAAGFENFASRWFVARQFIGLRARLVVEVVLWNMGTPFSDLVTGFRPGRGNIFARAAPRQARPDEPRQRGTRGVERTARGHGSERANKRHTTGPRGTERTSTGGSGRRRRRRKRRRSLEDHG